jgi:hypothetical protein
MEELIRNGARGGSTPVELTAKAKQTVTLDASSSKDPDGHTLHYHWWVYEEAGLAGTQGADVTVNGAYSAQTQVTIKSPCRPARLAVLPCKGEGGAHHPGSYRRRNATADLLSPRNTSGTGASNTVTVTVAPNGTPTVVANKAVLFGIRLGRQP